MSDAYEEPPYHKDDLTRVLPAARCRDCGVITWWVSLMQGNFQKTISHKRGCTEPRGRLDLLQKIPLPQRDKVLGGRLLRTMTDEAVEAAIEELKL